MTSWAINLEMLNSESSLHKTVFSNINFQIVRLKFPQFLQMTLISGFDVPHIWKDMRSLV